ncbi:hypothetical protein, partial [Amycolatopsis deserti]|uniref:hypothetical protein n=1 Tax=Amycolatopsis deserti TaxID=185696 RepID=UPI001E4DCAAC
YPQLPVFRHAAPVADDSALFAALLDVDQGDILMIENLPLGDDRAMVLGYRETITPIEHRFTFNAEPGDPWNIGVTDDPDTRADAEGSTLAGAATSTATTLSVASTTVPWIDSASYGDQFPFNITVGGEEMTVTAVGPAAVDTFTRTVSGGWGTADTGQAWTTTGGAASNYSTNGTAGQMALTSVNVSRWASVLLGVADIDVAASFATSAIAAGAPVVAWLAGRWTDISNWYAARLNFNTDGTVTLGLWTSVAGSETNLLTSASLGSYTTGQLWRVRFQITGTTLLAKAWRASGSEPTEWTVAASATAIAAAGDLGIRTRLNTGNTNALPVTITVDDVQVSTPQRFTVTRSVNGIVKAHPAGATVQLADPVYAGLGPTL